MTVVEAIRIPALPTGWVWLRLDGNAFFVDRDRWGCVMARFCAWQIDPSDSAILENSSLTEAAMERKTARKFTVSLADMSAAGISSSSQLEALLP